MLFIEVNLKRENDKHPVDIFFNLFNPAFIPCPEFGRDVIEGFESGVFCKLSDPEVETRIINKDYNIWLIFSYLLPAKGEIFGYGSQIFNNCNEAHEGQLSVMYEECRSGRFHQITAPAEDLCTVVSLK